MFGCLDVWIVDMFVYLNVENVWTFEYFILSNVFE